MSRDDLDNRPGGGLRGVPKLIWNASASVPIGLHAAKPASVHYRR
jgi:type IV secretory pathway protease TraF